MPATIDQLIINSPYEEPSRYWSYHRETRMFALVKDRRHAGYVRASALEMRNVLNSHSQTRPIHFPARRHD